MKADPDAEKEEYETLFYGINGRIIIPYASWYRTNRLTGKPLAILREDLHCLGIERVAGNAEPEDHAAALCETMALLCLNSDGDDTDSDQAAFFREHLEPWIESFFSDLSESTGSGFYRAVANISRCFFRIERDLHGLVPENDRDEKEVQ
ncbi:MAG: TorD/DmsD family molecular chaperone [Thermodesulfobacteriota bacterium]